MARNFRSPRSKRKIHIKGDAIGVAKERCIRHSFFHDENVVECSGPARLLLIGLWCFSNDRGIHHDSIDQIKTNILPSTDPEIIEGFIRELISAKLVARIVVNGKPYIQILDPYQHFAIARLGFGEWQELRKEVFERDGYKCVYCGRGDLRLECDHYIPISRGGSNDIGNLKTACYLCNRAKWDKLPEEWKR